jgi:hypothetical protein
LYLWYNQYIFFVKKSISFFVAFLFFTNIIIAQNTLQYNDEKGSPDATLKEMSWLTGNWKGTSPFGNCEEIWSEASAGTMPFSFKLQNENKVVFYEFGHIIQKDKSLQMQIRHFDANLKPWEADTPEIFNLVKIENNRYYFDGITYEKINDNLMYVYVFLEDSKEEIKFSFTK